MSIYICKTLTIKSVVVFLNIFTPALVGTPWEFVRVEENEGAIECAKQLKKNLPIGAELFIL